MSLSNRMEEYYQKIIHLQEKLRQSEEERLRLEMKFNEMLQMMKEEEEAHFKKLRSKYKQFLEDDRRRQQRNDKILEALDRIENRTAIWETKTQKFKAARKKYCDYLKQVGAQRSRSPFDCEVKLDQTDLTQDYKPTFIPSYSNDLLHSKRDGNDGTNDVMEKYLQNVSSDKCKNEVLHKRSSSPKNKYSNLGNINSIYWKNPAPTEKADKEKGDKFDSTQLKTTKDIQNTLRQNSSVSVLPDYSYDDKRYQTPNGFSSTKESLPSNLKFDQAPPKHDVESYTAIKSHKQNALPTISTFPTPTLTSNSIKNSSNENQETPPVTSIELSQLNSLKHENQMSPVKLDDQPPISFQNNDNSIPVNSVDDQEYGAGTGADYEPFPPLVNDEIKLVEQTQPQQVNMDEEKPVYIEDGNTEPDNGTREDIEEQSKTDDVSSVISSEQKVVDEKVTEKINDVEKQDPAVLDNVKEQADEQPVQHYETSGQPPQQYDDTGQYYDESGQLVVQYDQNGQPIQQFNENGQPIHQYDQNGQLAQQFNENDQPIQQYDQNGQPLQQFDENGQPLQQYDENGQPVQQYDGNGQALQQYDENGQPMQQYYDENGQLQMQYYDENGQPLTQYYGSGEQPLQQFDENQVLVQYDENGQPIAQYSEGGQPDESGQPLQGYYNEHGQPVQYYGENAGDQQYDPSSQPVQAQYEDQQQPQEQEPQQVHEQEDIQKPVEAKPNVLEMLETDTESTKQDTKLSNDSDFDFSNA